MIKEVMKMQTVHIRSILSLGIMLLVLAACSGEEVTLQRLPDDAVILALGDSLTSGYGARPEQSYPSVLQQLSGKKVVNAGVSGEVSENGLRRLPGLLKRHQPDLLILCHGGNDILRKKSMSKMRSNLIDMIELAKNENIPVLLLGVPKPGLFLSSYEVYQSIAEETGVFFIDDLIPDILGDNDLKSDTVHPNSDGYTVMAETIYTYLKNSGAF